MMYKYLFQILVYYLVVFDWLKKKKITVRKPVSLAGIWILFFHLYFPCLLVRTKYILGSSTLLNQ